MWIWPVLMLIGFACGSVPCGLLIGRAHGIDVRRHGSGNVGATNVGRLLGRRAFVLCLSLDVLKGLAPTLLAGWVSGLLGLMPPPPREAALWLVVMATPVLGHMYSPWIGFRGGKGVAAGLGALMGVFPALTVPALATLAVWLVAVKVSRYVSVASVAAAVSLPAWVGAWFALRAALGPPEDVAAYGAGVRPFLVATGVLAALVVWKHRGNLGRVRAGTEPRIGQRLHATPDPNRGIPAEERAEA